MQPARRLESPAAPENLPEEYPAAIIRLPAAGKLWSTVARGLLIGAGVGLVWAALFLPAGWGVVTRSTLIHAFEGALVGGLCDWFAVWKTYSAVEKKSTAVADEIGRWVSKELLSHHIIRSKLQAILADPDAKQQLYSAVDAWVGDETEARRTLSRAWARAQPHVVEFVVQYQLEGGDLDSAQGLLEDERMVAAVGHCLGTALEDLGKSPELEKAVAALVEEQGVLARFIAKLFMDVPAELAALGTRIRRDAVRETKSGTLGPLLAAAARRGGAAYIRGWNKMRVGQRREAATALVEHLSDPVLSAAAKLLVEQRDRLRSLVVLGEHPIASRLVEVLDRVLDERFSDQIGRFVSDALKSQSPAELRANVERQTGRYLQLIRVNGTVLGLALGAVLGLILARH